MKNPFKDLPRSIWALFAVRLIIAAGNFVFPFLTLILTTRLGWSADRAGLFLTIMQAAALPGVLMGGKLSDSVGRKRIIITCQGIAAILFFICLAVGFKPILPYLIAGASVLLAMTWPISGALVADLAPPETRKNAYALLYWGNNIGFSVGPLAAGFLLHRAPGLMFAGNACALCISIFILIRFVPETVRIRPDAARKEDASIGKEPEQAAQAAPTMQAAQNSSEAGFRGSLWAILRERPEIIFFVLLVAVMNFVYSQQSFSLPLYLNERMGERGSEVFGSAMTVNGLTVVFCTLLLSRLTAKVPVLVIMAIAAFLYGLGFGLLALPPSFLLVVVSTIVWTWGEILAATNINVYIASKTPMTHRGRVNSFTSLITNLGSLSGPVLAGVIIRAEGIRAVWPIAFSIATIAGILMLVLAAYDRANGPVVSRSL